MSDRYSPNYSPRRNQQDDENRYRQYLEAEQPSKPVPSQPDQIQKAAGFAIGLSSVFAEQILSHPCKVIRRQCQVHHNGEWYHLTPFTLIQVLINRYRHQGMGTIWKGLGSVFVVSGFIMISDTVISEITPLPKEVSRHSSIKKDLQHVLLKGLTFALTTPLFASSLIETIQSDIASERPGVFDCIKEAATRIMGWGMPQTTRLLPIWKLVLPTVIFRVAHYVICSVAQYTVVSSIRSDQLEDWDSPDASSSMSQTLYDEYFPDLIGTFSGAIIADIALYPLETVLNRMYIQGTRTIIDNMDTGFGVIPINTGYEGFVDCFQSIVIEEGLQGLYRGFGALLLQYAIHAAILRMARILFVKLTDTYRPKQRRSMPPMSPNPALSTSDSKYSPLRPPINPNSPSYYQYRE
ncbi:hypothetical protein LOTGIDRAFT_162156 [Lottia gigantea]|uniref:Solute carrier family 25 member 46 n=1 Tax=Lottia gigantea TaxID=225164 RepID=V4BVR9_LOTGI|nr:hypothetical protein LOTGIDRAFT_162156 [Lottia gigantea]ESO93129.1 hypothetical protein LOTGIDRAFT_162156 [Lottia gigantea]